LLFRHLADRGDERLFLGVTFDGQVEFAADLGFGNDAWQIEGAIDRVTGRLDDHVACLQPGLRGRAVRHHRRDEAPSR
jgi:hypothetical protein